MSALASRDGLSLRAPIAASAALHLALVGRAVLCRAARRAVADAADVPREPGRRAAGAAAGGRGAAGRRRPRRDAGRPAPPAPARASRSRRACKARPAKAPRRAKAPTRADAATPHEPATGEPPRRRAGTRGGRRPGGRPRRRRGERADGGDRLPVSRVPAERRAPDRAPVQAVACAARCTAEVAFLIRRDGTIAGLRLTQRSACSPSITDALARRGSGGARVRSPAAGVHR